MHVLSPGAVGASVPALRQVMFCPGAQPQNRGGSSAPEPWGKLSPRTVGEAQPQNRGGSSAPEPWRELSPRTVGVPVYHFHTKGCMPLAGVMLRVCPSDACVEALPPAPLSRPAFGGKVFEQVIELNEAIRVGPDPIDPVSLWEEGIRI